MPLRLLVTRSGGDLTQPLMVYVAIDGTAIYIGHTDDLGSQGSLGSLGTQGGIFITIPANLAQVVHNAGIRNDLELNPTATIINTIIPLPEYTVGPHGTDTVFLLDNDIRITNAKYKFTIKMYKSSGVWDLSELNANTIANQIVIDVVTNITLTALTEAAVQVLSNAFVSAISSATALPSGWILDLYDLVLAVGTSDCELTITYDIGDQIGKTLRIVGGNIGNNSFSFGQGGGGSLTFLGDFVTNPQLLQNAISSVIQTMCQTLDNQANAELSKMYPNHETYWEI